MTLFHATDGANRQGIEKNGLYAQPTEAALRIHRGAGVWLFSSLVDAEAFSAENFNANGDGWIIYSVDTYGLNVIDDPEYAPGASYICTEDVPADRLVITVDTTEETQMSTITMPSYPYHDDIDAWRRSLPLDLTRDAYVALCAEINTEPMEDDRIRRAHVGRVRSTQKNPNPGYYDFFSDVQYRVQKSGVIGGYVTRSRPPAPETEGLAYTMWSWITYIRARTLRGEDVRAGEEREENRRAAAEGHKLARLANQTPIREPVAVLGNTYPIREQLSAMGGKWDPVRRYWVVDKSRYEEAKALVERTNDQTDMYHGPAPEIPEEETDVRRRYVCYRCKRQISPGLAMSGSYGTLCPDCYDREDT